MEQNIQWVIWNLDEKLWSGGIFFPKKRLCLLREKVKAKKNPTALSLVKFEPIEEGKCVQIMHIGPYSEEGPTVEKNHNFAFEQGYQLRGRHREIYISDIRRTQPEKLKTIIRQPIVFG